MKLIGVELGRIVVLHSQEERRPTRGFDIAKAVHLVQERYGFLEAPNLQTTLSQISKDGYKFSAGSIDIDGGPAIIDEFVIFNDGRSITSLDTAFSEAFLDDFLAWSVEALSMRPYVREPRRLYRSQLVAAFDQPMSGLIRSFSRLSQTIAPAMQQFTGLDLPVNLARVDFAFDPTKIQALLKPVPFLIERRINTPYEDERYFCEAPLPTAHSP